MLCTGQYIVFELIACIPCHECRKIHVLILKLFFSDQFAKETKKFYKPPAKRVGRWRPGTQALREIQRYQRTVRLCISKLPFLWYSTVNFMSSVLKDMTAMYNTVHRLNVMSVERYKYYVQYSRLVKCRECRKIQVLYTVQYMG